MLQNKLIILFLAGLLAFSFGERPTVNSQIRLNIEQECGSMLNPPRIYAQWEIADMAPFGPGAHLTFHRIGLDPGKDYITTREVIQKFKLVAKYDAGAKVFLACQSWHASRCWRYCKEEGLNIVGGMFADLFSPNDPQAWVRDELASERVHHSHGRDVTRVAVIPSIQSFCQ